jgi:thiol-disulfide isomerase/thioredoxin
LLAVFAIPYFYPKFNPATNVANANRNHTQFIIYFFWTDWCPHCKKAKPDWLAFQQQFNDSVLNNFHIQCIDVDCSHDSVSSNHLLSLYNVSSFPSVIAIKNTQLIEFDGKVNLNNLTQFLQTETQ